MSGRLDKRVDKRLDKRRDSLDAIGRLMRERAALAPAPVPPPLHKMAAARAEGKRP